MSLRLKLRERLHIFFRERIQVSAILPSFRKCMKLDDKVVCFEFLSKSFHKDRKNFEISRHRQNAFPRLKSYVTLYILVLYFFRLTCNMLKMGEKYLIGTSFPISVGTNKQSEKLTLRLCLYYITRLLCISVLPTNINACVLP